MLLTQNQTVVVTNYSTGVTDKAQTPPASSPARRGRGAAPVGAGRVGVVGQKRSDNAWHPGSSGRTADMTADVT